MKSVVDFCIKDNSSCSVNLHIDTCRGIYAAFAILDFEYFECDAVKLILSDHPQHPVESIKT